jgi:DNA repair protein RecO (recombination protein O)
MIHHTIGIALNYIEYSETSIIATIYTEKFGRQSYIINKVKTGKSKFKAGYFQPLILLNLEVYNNPKKELQRIKELSSGYPLKSIPFDIKKSSIAFFTAELLLQSIKEEERNQSMFEYIFNSIILLDEMKQAIQNFHLLFILRLTKYLGFYPKNNFNTLNCYFDLANGEFISSKRHNYILEVEDSILLSNLLNEPNNNYKLAYINNQNRSILINKLIEYYKLHNHLDGQLKSLKVLNEVFH